MPYVKAHPLAPNEILHSPCGTFFISYNPGRGSDMFGIGQTMGMLAEAITGKEVYRDSRPETAIVTPHADLHYRILNGDYRKEYEGLISQGLAACIAFYESQKDEAQSVWSSDTTL